jgi:hypothetical protein
MNMLNYLHRSGVFYGLTSLTGLVGALVAAPAFADPVLFSNGNVDGRMAVASRPATAGKFEIEAADDFVAASRTAYNHLTFTGLLTGGATVADISQIVTEFYRVFPKDSNAGGVPQVPTRVNSPSDVELTDRDSATGGLTFSVAVLANTFTASNSVQPGGIHPTPNPTTGGNGPLTGVEILIDVVLSTAIDLDADHYYFVPQVALDRGNFYWLSSARPIVAPGTPFGPDLQGWTRDAQLAPDWLRIGTDIVGGVATPTFNFAFSIDGQTVDGQTVPEPSTLALVLLAVGASSASSLSARSKRYR